MILGVLLLFFTTMLTKSGRTHSLFKVINNLYEIRNPDRGEMIIAGGFSHRISEIYTH
ncbi:hypothetical protein ADICYQ_3135 [Cyclobacterium qasimii M12-11B]|uniref:Uncharacterized protein n=1 Tax=Cyclobacterium qasimii M12-11B TaxID=641524 RepID=S7WVF7_9BACT|nr:hypothetical protein ADICYQ_3135 [Cyclobacterium qasimii M12-11B]